MTRCLEDSAALPQQDVPQQAHFRTDRLSGDLKRHAVRGGAATGATQAALFLFRFASVPVMARLLTPEDYGLIAMVTAVTGFIALFEDAGLSTATVQRAEISHAQVSTLFWINVTLGAILTVITACLAPGIAWFYGEPRLVGITLALAGIMLLGSLNVQHRALLQRQMRFGTLGGVRIAAQLVSLAVGITAALLGAGYWALVLMTFSSTATTVVLIWAASGWRPGAPRRDRCVRGMVTFGANLTVAQFLTYARRNVDNILLGRFWGAQTLGIYSKAYALLMLPVRQLAPPIWAVAIPTLSRLQNDHQRFRQYFRMGTELFAAAGAPIAVFTFVAVREIVMTLLGDQWTATIPVFQALAPAALVTFATVGPAWVFISLGRADRQLRASLFDAAAVVAGICLGLPWGAVGVAWGFTISFCTVRLAIVVYASHDSPVNLLDFWAAVWRPVLCSLASATGVLLLKVVGLRCSIAFVGLFVDLGLFSVFYVLGLMVMPGGREFFSRLKSVVRYAVTKKDAGNR